MNERRSKGVLIGAGYFAQFQAEGWQRIGAAEIAAVVDAVPGKAEQFAAKYGIARTGSHVTFFYVAAGLNILAAVLWRFVQPQQPLAEGP